MVTRCHIESNLQDIDSLFTASGAAPQRQLFYAKLAIIELGGWTETSLDDIILRVADRHIRTVEHRKLIDANVDRTYGFEYEKHFLGMLISIIGRQGVEKFERKADPLKIDPMVAALKSMKLKRNIAAHTFLKGATTTVDAPSATIIQFRVIFTGLKEIERVLVSRPKRKKRRISITAPAAVNSSQGSV